MLEQRLDFSEYIPGEEKIVGGVLKFVGEPVGVILGPYPVETGLYCELLYLHPGLIPGDYELKNGMKVIIPARLCGTVEHRGITLEVTDGG